MQCAHTLEANRQAHNLGVFDKLKEQQQAYINIQAELIISSKNSPEYKFLIEFTLDELNLLPKYDALVNQIINSDGEQLTGFKNQLRDVMKQAAAYYVEQNINGEN